MREDKLSGVFPRKEETLTEALASGKKRFTHTQDQRRWSLRARPW